MTSKKICMLGSFAVGKTSLVSQFVSSIFSDKYLSTVGVKVDRKSVSVKGQDVTLMLWDLYGEDGFQRVQKSYLRGASGYLLVAACLFVVPTLYLKYGRESWPRTVEHQ